MKHAKIIVLKIFQGDVNRDINLNFDAETSVYGSCGATLNGQFIIIGGRNEKRQVNNKINSNIINLIK